jgi:carbon starvation protein CstA
VEGRAVPVPVHHHRLRRGVRFPRADLLGTTPKLLDNETNARYIGYGGMLMESFVAIMAMVAASVIEPGVYFAMNSPAAVVGGDVVAVAQAVSSWGFAITPTPASSGQGHR